MADGASGDVFLLLPRVLLEGGTSTDGLGVEGLDLFAIEHLLERVQAEGGGELLRTMPLIEGRPPLYGTKQEQVSEKSSPLLADLDLAVRDIEPFFTCVRRFTTFTFFSQPGGNSPAYKYHPFSFSCHSNIANLLCFLAYTTTNLVGSNNQKLVEMIA